MQSPKPPQLTGSPQHSEFPFSGVAESVPQEMVKQAGRRGGSASYPPQPFHRSSYSPASLSRIPARSPLRVTSSLLPTAASLSGWVPRRSPRSPGASRPRSQSGPPSPTPMSGRPWRSPLCPSSPTAGPGTGPAPPVPPAPSQPVPAQTPPLRPLPSHPVPSTARSRSSPAPRPRDPAALPSRSPVCEPYPEQAGEAQPGHAARGAAPAGRAPGPSLRPPAPPRPLAAPPAGGRRGAAKPPHPDPQRPNRVGPEASGTPPQPQQRGCGTVGARSGAVRVQAPSSPLTHIWDPFPPLTGGHPPPTSPSSLLRPPAGPAAGCTPPIPSRVPWVVPGWETGRDQRTSMRGAGGPQRGETASRRD